LELWLEQRLNARRQSMIEGFAVVRSSVAHPPNNFASLLLIIAGAVSAPVGIGLVFLLTGLALLREANGEVSFPQLQGWLRLVQQVQFWRITRL